MRSRTVIGWLVAVLVLCLGSDAAAGSALLPGDGDEDRRVTLTSRRPVRQPKPSMPRATTRLVLVSSAPAPGSAPRVTAPDGQVYCWRRHANGQLAAVVAHADGSLTARLWPSNDTFSTGMRELGEAQRAADALAHAGDCSFCRPWSFT